MMNADEIYRLRAENEELRRAMASHETSTPRQTDDYTWPEAFHDVQVLLNKSKKLIVYLPRSLDPSDARLKNILVDARDEIERVLSSTEYKHENQQRE